MRAMDVGVEAAASPQCMVPLQARLELVNAIGQLNVGSAVLHGPSSALLPRPVPRRACQCLWLPQCRSYCMVPLQARLELVNAIGQLNVGPAMSTCSKMWTEACIVTHAAFQQRCSRPVMASTDVLALYMLGFCWPNLLAVHVSLSVLCLLGDSLPPVLNFSF